MRKEQRLDGALRTRTHGLEGRADRGSCRNVFVVRRPRRYSSVSTFRRAAHGRTGSTDRFHRLLVRSAQVFRARVQSTVTDRDQSEGCTLILWGEHRPSGPNFRGPEGDVLAGSEIDTAQHGACGFGARPFPGSCHRGGGGNRRRRSAGRSGKRRMDRARANRSARTGATAESAAAGRRHCQASAVQGSSGVHRADDPPRVGTRRGSSDLRRASLRCADLVGRRRGSARSSKRPRQHSDRLRRGARRAAPRRHRWRDSRAARWPRDLRGRCGPCAERSRVLFGRSFVASPDFAREPASYSSSRCFYCRRHRAGGNRVRDP